MRRAGAAPRAPHGRHEQAQNPINDQGSNSNYRSTSRRSSPDVPGLSLQVLEFADRLLLRNHTGKTVTIYGYEGEPYARVLANGTAEVNKRSPAYLPQHELLRQRHGAAGGNAKAPPQWKVIDRTGQFEWHDHRIHWMSPALPPQVKDKGKRTLIFDWHVPIAVGAQQGRGGRAAVLDARDLQRAGRRDRRRRGDRRCWGWRWCSRAAAEARSQPPPAAAGERPAGAEPGRPSRGW